MQWFAGNVATAIQVSRKNRALLVVYISTDNEEGKVFDDFWHQVEPKSLSCPVVGIKLTSGEVAAKQFAEIYPAPIVPAAYLIDSDGKPLEVITFLVGKTYEQFRNRFDRGVGAFVEKNGAQPVAPMASEVPEAAPPAPTASESAPRPSESAPVAPPAPEAAQAQDAALAAKIAHARKLLEEKYKKDAQKQKEAEKFTQGEMKKAAEAKQERENKALIEAAKERRKEKLEAQKEKERILAQIRADREDAKKKLEAQKAVKNEEYLEKVEKKKAEVAQLKAVASERCRLQVRLPDGSTFVEEFPSNDVLNSLVAIIQQKPGVTSSFEIHQHYPRRIFKVEDYEKTFLENKLTPSTSLVVVLKPSQVENVSKAVVANSGSLLNMLFSPVWLIWGWFCNILSSGSANSKKKEPENAQSGGVGAAGRAGGAGGRGLPRESQVRRRGNVAGLDNPNDDDPDERASFNGNSTQFL